MRIALMGSDICQRRNKNPTEIIPKITKIPDETCVL